MLMLTVPPVMRNEQNMVVASLRECADDFLHDLSQALLDPSVVAAFDLVRYWLDYDITIGELGPSSVTDRLSDATFDLQVALGMSGAASLYLTMSEFTAEAFGRKLTAEATSGTLYTDRKAV